MRRWNIGRWKNNISLGCSLVVLLGLVFFPMANASAADPGINLQISPLPIILDTEPGATISSDLRVRNAGITNEKLKVSLRTFRAEGDSGNVVLKDRGPTDAHFDWVSFDRPSFDAPPNEWQTIKMKIKVPKTAAFGYYYAVQFERVTPIKPQPGQNAVEGAIAIFVLLDVKNPGASRSAEIVSFKATKKFYEFLPAEFSVVVRNTGNVHLSPHGTIFIQRDQESGGEPIATIPFNPSGGYILPKSNRTFTASWNDGFPVYQPKIKDGQEVKDKNGRAERELEWDFNKSFNKLRFGNYTANLVVVYDDGRRDVPLGANLDFWVIPWRVIGIVMILSLPIIWFGVRYRSVRRQLKRLKGASKSNKR